MTYKNLVKFIKENDNNNDFDLTQLCVKSKIIFVIGDNATNTGSMLSSVMSACEISHSRYANSECFELRDRFIRLGEQIPIDEICQMAQNIKKISEGAISSDDLLLSISLSLLDGEYIILEMSEEYYASVINRINFEPFAILFCSSDDKKNAELISKAPKGTHICALSQAPCHDYMPRKDENGRKTALISPNKITLKGSGLLGADFYHFSYLYHLPCIDMNNIPLAALVIESAAALLGAPRPYIYKGLSSAYLPCDLQIFSLSPIILIRIGKNDFAIPKGLVFKRITGYIPTQMPNENTVFYGNKEYIDNVKKQYGN